MGTAAWQRGRAQPSSARDAVRDEHGVSEGVPGSGTRTDGTAGGSDSDRGGGGRSSLSSASSVSSVGSQAHRRKLLQATDECRSASSEKTFRWEWASARGRKRGLRAASGAVASAGGQQSQPHRQCSSNGRSVTMAVDPARARGRLQQVELPTAEAVEPGRRAIQPNRSRIDTRAA